MTNQKKMPKTSDAEKENKIFDLTKLRLSQDFSETAGVKKVILTIPTRKPGRQDFFRVHPSDDYYLETAVLELKEERETYLIDPDLWHELPGEIIPKALFTTINRQGVLTIWPVRLPGPDGRHDSWNRSALEAAQMAKKNWIRMAANMSLGAYEIYKAVAELPEPEWPDMTFQKIIEIAFKDNFIRRPDHPVIRQLRGEL
jgi:hypothetical protein